MGFKSLQEECFEANLALPKYKLVDLTWGNVSVLDRAGGVFAIKPSGVKLEKATSRDMVVLDLEGRIVTGSLRPSSDTPTHLKLYQAFSNLPDVGAIVHTHSRNAVAFAQAGKAIPCFGTTHADHFYGEIPVTRPMLHTEIGGDYERETANVIIERFAQMNPALMNAILVHGHGPFTWGSTSKKAVENALALEIVAEMARKTLQLNPDAQSISQELLDKHFFRKHGTKSYYGQLAFNKKEINL